MSLIIRQFVLGKDEEIWVNIGNEAWKEFEDYTPDTVHMFKKWEKSPWFTTEGMFIVELNGVPVGRVKAEIEKERTDNKGSLRGPYILPGFRRKGIGEALARKAFESLKLRGMGKVEAWATNKNPVGQIFLKKFGFIQVRVFSTMRRNLSDIPSGTGESETVDLILLGKTEDDVKLINQLDNEIFKEHFNHRPQTMEETRYYIQNSEENGFLLFIFLARIKDEPVGYLSFGIYPEDNKFLGRKRGVLQSLGVLKNFRGQGIAKKLMIKGMEYLKAKGMEEAELFVDDANPTESFKLYEKLGFKVVKKHFTYLKTMTE